MAPMKRPAHDEGPASLSLRQVSRRWAIPRREVRHLLQRGDLPFEQVRGQLRVPVEALRRFEANVGG